MAKIITNGSMNYKTWQMKTYGNIIPGIESTPENELMDSGLEELNRLAEWISRRSRPDHLFILNPPATRIGRIRRKKRFDKIVFIAIHSE